MAKRKATRRAQRRARGGGDGGTHEPPERRARVRHARPGVWITFADGVELFFGPPESSGHEPPE